MSGIKRYDSNDSCEEVSDGDYVKFADHAAEISRIQSLFNTAVEGYKRATNRHSDAADKYIEAMQEIARLRAEADALRDGLEAVYQFGSDTLRGPTGDTPDDRKWHRTAVLEMTNRASRTIDTGSWKKDEGAAMGADA